MKRTPFEVVENIIEGLRLDHSVMSDATADQLKTILPWVPSSPPLDMPDGYPSFTSARSGKDIVSERDAIYGDAVKNIRAIAHGWTALLGVRVDPVQVCACMIHLKLIREINGQHEDDNFDDVEGYIEIARKVVEADANRVDPSGS